MQLVIIGAGGYGLTIAYVARQSGKYSEILFWDDNSDSVELSIGNAVWCWN